MKMIKPLTHKPSKRGWEPDAVRGTRQQRGYGAAWQRRRKVVLARDNYLCQVCRRRGEITPANQVDHIKPKAHGGTDDLENLQAICTECHKTKTTKESHGGRGGFNSYRR